MIFNEISTANEAIKKSILTVEMIDRGSMDLRIVSKTISQHCLRNALWEQWFFMVLRKHWATREESMVHNSVTQGMNTIYIIGLTPVICACSPVTGSWKRAGNSVFELPSTKRKLCRQRPTTWTTKASKMQQHDWISIRRILYISCVCEHVTRRTCCVFVRWAMKGFHGLDVRLSSRFPLSLIE